MMLKCLAPSRILFVFPDMAFVPEDEGHVNGYVNADDGPAGFPADLICNLLELGADLYVAQPDFRELFADRGRKKSGRKRAKLPPDRVHLAEDRAFFRSKPIDSNSERDNLKIALAFQREVINQIIPRIQPELIHCCDWMTGLIPAAAKKYGIPCLFTAQRFETARSCLAYVEDRGIDAAAFWQVLYYERYPLNYEETRESNPADLLLSGILAADFVTTSRSAYLADGCRIQNRAKFPIWEIIMKKSKCGRAIVHHHRVKTDEYIEIYESLLGRAGAYFLRPRPSESGTSMRRAFILR